MNAKWNYISILLKSRLVIMHDADDWGILGDYSTCNNSERILIIPFYKVSIYRKEKTVVVTVDANEIKYPYSYNEKVKIYLL